LYDFSDDLGQYLRRTIASAASARSNRLSPFGQVVVSAFQKQAVRTPLLKLPADPLCYAFNLVRIPATDALTGL